MSVGTAGLAETVELGNGEPVPWVSRDVTCDIGRG